jgi:hypothetical protein
LTGSQNSKHKEGTPLKCIDVQSWCAPTIEEQARFYKSLSARLMDKTKKRRKPSVLAVREHLSPVDVCCYLKARFGEPNGFLTHVLR